MHEQQQMPTEPAVSGEEGAPPRRRGPSRKVWVAIGAALLAVLVVCALGVRVGKDRPTDGPTSLALPQRLDWPTLQKLFQDQAAALLRGDEAGWLAPVDPGNKALVEDYRRQFHALRSLRVTAWGLQFGIPPVMTPDIEFKVPMRVFYCFAAPSCPGPSSDPEALLHAAQIKQVPLVTFRDNAFRITGHEAPESDMYTARPLPWEAGPLTFLDGARVTVAAPPGQAHRLGELVSAADRAATVNDRFARLVGRQPPARYVVYLAGDKEWNTWRGGQQRGSVIGYAYQSGDVRGDVVLKMSAIPRTELDDTLRHEFGHVVTVTGSDRLGSAIYNFDMWFVEGIAEYIANAPKPVTASARMPGVQAALRRGLKLNTFWLDPPPPKASASDMNAFYGLAHLGMSCMATRFGEAKMFAFFKAVVHDKTSARDASKRVYGQDWSTVQRDCLAYIHRTVGA